LSAPVRRAAVAFAIAAPLFVLACFVCEGGLLDGRPWGDVGNYILYGGSTLDGKVPYRDFYMEYPPAALPVFMLPAAFTRTFDPYLIRFKVEMVALGLVGLAGTAGAHAVLGVERRRLLVGMGLFAAAPALLGHIYLNRFDSWPAASTIGALLALLVARYRTGAALLGLAFAAKVFPIVVLPPAAIRIWRARGRRALVRATAVFVAVCVLAFGYFVVFAFHGLALSIGDQLRRHLEWESLGASILQTADRLGIHHVAVVPGNPGSVDIGGHLADAVAVLTSLLEVAAIVWIAWAYGRRGPASRERLVTAFAAAVAAFVALGKVLTPQYLVWLVPLVPLVAGRRGLVAGLLLAPALGAAQIAGEGGSNLHFTDWALAALDIRNLLLVVILVLLLRQLARPDPALH